MNPWWERFPGRIDQEIQSLDARGFKHRRDEQSWKEGQLVLRLSVPRPAQGPLELVAYYPDHYPYTRFEVVAAELDLPRHQHPFLKNLCLMGRASINWRTDDTLGEVLEAQLPKIFRFASEDAAALRALEEPQGEPITDSYAYFADTTVLVDSAWSIDPKAKSGRLKLGFSSSIPFRGAVTAVLDAQGQELVSAPSGFSRLFSQPARGRWIRLAEPIRETDPRRLLAALARHVPGLMQPTRSTLKALAEGQPEVLGVLFPEEVGQGTYVEGWIFLVQTKDRCWHLARACRAGRSDIGSRSPELAALPEKRVTVVGLGSVGAPGTVGLARHGVGLLKILDFDFVEAGTGARWPLGLAVAGRTKVDALASHIGEHYPYTVVERHPGVIGEAHRAQAPHYCDWRDFDGLFSTDLVLDCTAEVGISLLLADAAAENRVPYICASATPGGWGGLVFRQLPGADQVCWSCLRHAMSDGTVPSPPYDKEGTLQPVGCAAPTFTGAGVDIEHVSLMALRTAVSTLCRGAVNGYPDIDWNVAVLALRSEAGALLAPQWTTMTVQRHPGCRNLRAHGDDLGTRKAA